jgi:hypothetical protein
VPDAYVVPVGAIGLQGLRSTFERLERRMGPLPAGPVAQSADGSGMQIRMFRSTRNLDEARAASVGLVLLRPGTTIDVMTS